MSLTGSPHLAAQGFFCHECGFDHGEIDWNYRNVISPFWRLYYNFEAGNSVRAAGIAYSLHPDYLILVPAFYSFDCVGPRQAPHFWLHFRFPGHILFDQKIPLAVEANLVIRSLVQELRRTLSHGDELATSLNHLCHALLHLALQRVPSTGQKQVPQKLRDLLQFIEDKHGEKLSNALLAQRSGRSISAFIRWFREYLQSSPADYVTRIRLQNAARLLACTDQSIEEIAERCGFPNRHYFSRVFVRRFQIGPAAFRLNSRKQSA